MIYALTGEYLGTSKRGLILSSVVNGDSRFWRKCGDEFSLPFVGVLGDTGNVLMKGN